MTSPVDKDAVFKGLQDGVIVCTMEGEILESNPAFSEILGYKAEDIRNKNLARDIVERTLEWKALVSLLEQGSLISDYEIKLKRRDGALLNASISASILRKTNGDIVGIAMIIRDITTRKAIETELRDKTFRTDIVNKIAKITASETEVRKRALVAVCTELRKLINFDLLVVGITEDNGRHVEVLVPDQSSPESTKTLGRVLFQGSIVEALKFGRAAIIVDKDVSRKSFTELSVIKTDGFESMLSVPLASRGRTLGAINIFYPRASEYTWDTADTLQTVADQVAGSIDNLVLLSTLEAKIRLQDALVKSGLAIQRAISTEQIYAAIATGMRDIVSYTELSFYMVDWQKKMIYPVFAAGPFSDEVMADPGTIEEGVVGSVARSGQAEFMDDVDSDPRVSDIAGIPASHEAMLAIPLLGSENVLGVLELYRPHGEVFTVNDLEAGKLFAQQASVALENANLVMKLQEANKEIELLNDLMFHDINNYNFATMNYLEMIIGSNDLSVGHKESLEKSLHLIRQTASLIESVKKLTKIGVMNSKEFVPVNISEVLKKTVSGLENSFPGRSISVKLDVPESCYVLANSLVEELFMNLLSNSVKYDPHEDAEIDVVCERLVDEGRPIWRVCISDRGHGVSDDMKALLFQKYLRLKPDAKTPGTGLGLSICRALVDKFGGRIWAEDRVPGKSDLGARFCVTLPALKDATH
jgi:PAS domain S-box-containing protein